MRFNPNPAVGPRIYSYSYIFWRPKQLFPEKKWNIPVFAPWIIYNEFLIREKCAEKIFVGENYSSWNIFFAKPPILPHNFFSRETFLKTEINIYIFFYFAAKIIHWGKLFVEETYSSRETFVEKNYSYAHPRTCTHTHARTHARTHTHAHTHTHARTHTHKG